MSQALRSEQWITRPWHSETSFACMPWSLTIRSFNSPPWGKTCPSGVLHVFLWLRFRRSGAHFPWEWCWCGAESEKNLEKKCPQICGVWKSVRSLFGRWDEPSRCRIRRDLMSEFQWESSVQRRNSNRLDSTSTRNDATWLSVDRTMNHDLRPTGWFRRYRRYAHTRSSGNAIHWQICGDEWWCDMWWGLIHTTANGVRCFGQLARVWSIDQ